jgi:hypothetical protein
MRVVSWAIVSAIGGRKDKRFSNTPRMWNTPCESVGSDSSRRPRLAMSRSSSELFSCAVSDRVPEQAVASY